jgi:hypothetical protein
LVEFVAVVAVAAFPEMFAEIVLVEGVSFTFESYLDVVAEPLGLVSPAINNGYAVVPLSSFVWVTLVSVLLHVVEPTVTLVAVADMPRFAGVRLTWPVR